MIRHKVSVGALVLACSTLVSASEFVHLDVGQSQLGGQGTMCPVRVELSIGKAMGGKPSTYRTGKPARMKCSGAYVSVLAIDYIPGRGGLNSRVHVAGSVALSHGRDKHVELRYWIMQGDRELANGAESLEADEGVVNVGDGADLWLNAKAFDSSGPELSLRLEAEFSDR